MDTKHLRTTEGVDICEGVAWYANKKRLGHSHYDEFPIATDLDEFREDPTDHKALKNFQKYLNEGVIVINRNQSHHKLVGGAN